MLNSSELSERELEILRLVASGASNKEIAQDLCISLNTVKVHLRNIFDKTGVSSRTEAALYAMRMGWVAAPGEAGLSANAPAAEAPPSSIIIEPPAEPPAVRAEENLPSLNGSLPSTAKRGSPWLWALAAAGLLLVLLNILPGWLPPAITPTPAASSTAKPAGLSGQATPTPIVRWSKRAEVPESCAPMAGTAYAGNLYVFCEASSAAWRYQPEDDVWQALASAPVKLAGASAALAGEKIYLPGGENDGQGLQTLYIYNPRHNAWTQGKSLPQPVSGYALASFEGRLYLFGGSVNGKISDQVLVYDPAADTWQTRAPLARPLLHARAASLNGQMILIGGEDASGPVKSCQVYLPAREDSGETAWQPCADLPQPRSIFGLTTLADALYLISPGETLLALQYLPQYDSWRGIPYPTQPGAGSPLLLAEGDFIHFFSTQKDASHQVYQAIFRVDMPIIR
ncbi:MAG TPA: LuxR C-terminal-related transcriptional regulator [Anaerolineaceae bacterium]|nr:LuxR C-terminal-related transcriptional regulator [Anaerolineaceae bacterium]HPN53498.1 LuxR C-terminal-related transcriptional regulator [Anaerolineaceae bacterium]